MKAIVLAAGGPKPSWFPPDPKPPVLFHWHGEMILERVIRVLKESGIRDIRIVAGYKANLIEEMNERCEWGCEVVLNTRWEEDAVNSLLQGIKGVEDDVLIILGDLLVHPDQIRSFLECEAPLAWIKSVRYRCGAPLGWVSTDTVWPSNTDRQAVIVRVSKEKLCIFEDVYDNMNRYLERVEYNRGMYDGLPPSLGFGDCIVAALYETLDRNGPVADVELDSCPADLDYYWQMDESMVPFQEQIEGQLSNGKFITFPISLDDSRFYQKEYTIQEEDVIIDAGALVGAYALKHADIASKIYAFEPYPRNFRLLEENIEKNKLSNIVAYKFALGDRHARVWLYLNGSSAGRSLVFKQADGISPVTDISEKIDLEIDKPTHLGVFMVRLDNVIEIQEKVDFIKINVQGSEEDVLRGSTGLFEPPLHLGIAAYHYKDEMKRIIEFLDEYGFETSSYNNGFIRGGRFVYASLE